MSPGATGEKTKPASKANRLKAEGKTRVVELRGETAKEMEESVRGWLGIGEEVGVCVVSEGRRLSWRELAEKKEGKTAERWLG